MALEEKLLLLQEGTSTVAVDLGNQLHRFTGLVPPRTTMRLFFFLLESGFSAGQVIKMLGALAEEIKETSLPLITRPEDTISGFAVEEDSNRSEQQATFNHMNSGQRNVAALNFLSGQKQRNEPDPDEEEDFADNMVVVTAEEGYYETKAEEPIGQKARAEPDPDEETSSYTKSSKELDPDEVSGHNNKMVSRNSHRELWRSQATSQQKGDGNPNVMRDEPDPDEDAMCVHKGGREPDPDDDEMRNELDPDEAAISVHKNDEQDIEKTREEPDPDEDAMCVHKGGKEPDPDDDEMRNELDPDEAAISVHKNDEQDIEKMREEPDPDEDAVSVHEGKEPDPADMYNEPDPDETAVHMHKHEEQHIEKIRQEPDPDEDALSVHEGKEPYPADRCNEPDPDEAAVSVHMNEEQHIENLREEPDPDEAIGFSKESHSLEMSWDSVSTQEQSNQEIVLDQAAISMLNQQATGPDDMVTVLVWMLFTILRNVMDYPNHTKFHHLQKWRCFQQSVSQVKMNQSKVQV
ncbi:hypothetical protein CY35_04G128900 [Sphagnum magellanicum]|nr:hypothetical protein CY35_04G128900 [Sphagnum magellanicum]